jgi:uncharacterized surface protein with fasciclin (FAS1) repeats
MKKIAFSLRRLSLALLFGLALLSACQAPQEIAPDLNKQALEELEVNLITQNGNRKQSTIVQIAVDNPNFTALVAAVQLTGLVPPLADPDASLTVFAPTDDAFAKLPVPFNNAQNIAAITDNATIDALRNILLYHVVSGRRPSKSLRRPVEATTLKPNLANNDNQLYFSNNGNGVFVNGNTQVILADVLASNGIIHAIDNVLLPPDRNIVQIAVNNPAFTSLVAAVVKADLASVLSGGSFTVFAPTNDAFSGLPAPFNSAQNITAIADPAQIEALRQILLLHVGDGAPIFSTDLGNVRLITLGGSLGVDLSNGPTIRGAGNSQAANIVAVNILANNGVIHVIDQVLLPRDRRTVK